MARTTPNDPIHLSQTLAHHDAAIGSLTARMSGVETGLTTLSTNVSQGFKEVGEKLTGLQATRGPGWGQILTSAGGIVAVLSVIITGVTMIVASTVAPDLTQLKTVVSQLQKTASDQTDSERAELTRLRTQNSDETHALLKDLSEQVGNLKDSLAWRPNVTKK